jgi:predicted permease
MELNLYYVILALCMNEFVHVCSEAWAANEKVARLSARIEHEQYKEMKIKVDTRLKSYAISIAIMLILVPLFYIGLEFINLGTNAALILSALTLIASYVVGFVWMDKYHVNIEKISRKFDK